MYVHTYPRVPIGLTVTVIGALWVAVKLVWFAVGGPTSVGNANVGIELSFKVKIV